MQSQGNVILILIIFSSMYCHSHRQSKTIKRLWAKFNQTGRARDIQQRSRSKPKVQIKATFKKVRGIS